ncbi:auxin-responsive protein SAUR61-like [Argentina anserina]|uniref:auxin-responsive protein SAUR61-like n=1 Tax=Argentina anserina TaxID=57926 RepID=UPI00217650AF|nr:auxin-responsive protein SAUR61-like [Potentilla anserina]
MEILLSPKTLIKLTTKLHKVPVMRRRKTSNSYRKAADSNSGMNSSAADKGTFVIYTLDKRRFVLPLTYLSNYMFQELFKMSEEEFGISSEDPIVFPCDSRLMNYIVSLVKLGMSADLEKALLNSIIKNSCSISTSDCQGQTSLLLLLCGY